MPKNKEIEFVTGIIKRRSISMDMSQFQAILILQDFSRKNQFVNLFKFSTEIKPKITEIIEKHRQHCIQRTGVDPLKDFLNGRDLPFNSLNSCEETRNEN